jgi:hypothetical protein
MTTGFAHAVVEAQLSATTALRPTTRRTEREMKSFEARMINQFASGLLNRATCAAAVIGLLLGCSSGQSDSSIARGRGLDIATLPVAAQAEVYEQASRAAFDLGPRLVLLLHPLKLPRSAGYAGGDSVPKDLIAALRKRNVVSGTCTPQRDTPRNTPRCPVNVPGYIIRASDILRVSPDTVEIYYAAERFGAATGQRPVALRFEKIYQLVGSGSNWRVVREARVREPEGRPASQQ